VASDLLTENTTPSTTLVLCSGKKAQTVSSSEIHSTIAQLAETILAGFVTAMIPQGRIYFFISDCFPINLF